MATLVVYPSLDGYVQKSGSSAAWATLQGAATGDTADDTTAATTSAVGFRTHTADDTFRDIYRSFLLFNTAALGGAIPTAGTLSVFGSGTTKNDLAGNGIGVVSSSPASNSALATADFNTVGTTRFGTDLPLSGWSTIAYNVFTLNASGLAAVSPSSITKFGLRVDDDIDNTPPTIANGRWSDLSDVYAGMKFSEDAGTSRDPMLTLTYTPVSGALLKMLQHHGAYL